MKKIFWIPLIACLLTLASCDLFTVTENEKLFFVTPGNFSEYNVVIPDDYRQYEKYAKTYMGYLSPQITYSYEPTGADSEIRYISETILFERRFFDALINKTTFDSVYKLALSASNIEMREEKGMYPNKYKAKVYSLIGENGQCVGSALSARVKKTIFTCTIVGVSLSTEEEWKDIFDKKLSQLGD